MNTHARSCTPTPTRNKGRSMRIVSTARSSSETRDMSVLRHATSVKHQLASDVIGTSKPHESNDFTARDLTIFDVIVTGMGRLCHVLRTWNHKTRFSSGILKVIELLVGISSNTKAPLTPTYRISLHSLRGSHFFYSGVISL